MRVYNITIALIVLFLSISSFAADLIIGKPILNGTGCMQGTVEMGLSEAGNDLILIPRNMSVSVNKSKKLELKNCSIAIPIQMAPGKLLEISNPTLSGSLSVGKGATAMLSAESFIAGQKGIKLQKNFMKSSKLNFVIVPETVEISQVSECGGSFVLRVNTIIKSEVISGKSRANLNLKEIRPVAASMIRSC